MDDIEAINKMANEQLNKFAERTANPIMNGAESSLWGSSEVPSRYRPSGNRTVSTPTAGSTSNTPVTGYMGRIHYTTSETSAPTRNANITQERLMAAVYRAPATERRVRKSRERAKMDFSSNLFITGYEVEDPHTKRMPQKRRHTPSPAGTGMPVPVKRRREMVSSSTKNQLIAILFSGVSRLVSTLIFNWARDNKVPPELL